MAERAKHRRHHHPEEGESRFPVTEGEQHGPHEPGERDPHEPLNRPEEETPDVVHGKAPEPDGMGKRPPARGERRASRRMPDADE
jgi:hypothetical protein